PRDAADPEITPDNPSRIPGANKCRGFFCASCPARLYMVGGSVFFTRWRRSHGHRGNHNPALAGGHHQQDAGERNHADRIGSLVSDRVQDAGELAASAGGSVTSNTVASPAPGSAG